MFVVQSGSNFRLAKVKLILLLCICFATAHVHGQPTDCATTIPVCSNGTINQSSNGSGINDFAFAGNAPGCLVTNEHQSVWLYVQIESGTTLGFDIFPNVLGEDYDFAVFGPNVNCHNLGTPIRCSYAAPFGNAATGMNGSNNDFSEGASGNGYVSWINTTVGDSYYILVDNFSASNQGFTLIWTGSANLDCSITLPCPELDLGPNTSVCDGGTRVLGGATGPNDEYLWSTGATTPSITVSDSGIYWQEIVRGNCTVRDTIYISLAITPQINLGNDTLLCEGSTLVLNATDPIASNYLWQDGHLSPLYTVSSAGIYSVEVYNQGCVGTDEIEVSYDPMPIIDLGSDTILCDGVSLSLNGSSPLADSYEWQDGSTSPTFTVLGSGNYWVLASNSTCTNGDTITVTFAESPVFDLDDEATRCEGSTLTINAFSPNGSDYLWQDGSTNFELDATTSGTYTVTVSNRDCSATDSLQATFIPYPVYDLGADTVVCDGNSLVLNAFSPVATEYIWMDGSSGETFNVTAESMYSVIVKNDFCATADSILVQFDDFPRFSLGPDTLLCHGDKYPITIDGEADYLYLWQDNSTNPSFTVTEQDEYYLAVENQCGVRYDTVTVLYGSCNCDFFFPTGFTPNGDGLNDSYYPFVDCDSLQSYHLEIFNRWGERLFETDDTQQDWRISASNSEFLMDVYVWIIEYKWTWLGKAMQRREKGHFSIIK